MAGIGPAPHSLLVSEDQPGGHSCLLLTGCVLLPPSAARPVPLSLLLWLCVGVLAVCQNAAACSAFTMLLSSM